MINITQINTPQGRFYEVAGVLYPSVTTILQTTMPQEQQERLELWRQQQKTTESETTSSVYNAADRGTKIHSLIAAFLQGQPQDCPEELLEFWHPARKIVAALTNPVAIEQAVYHPILRYAGTLDLIALWQERLTIFDWKTSYRSKQAGWLGDAPLQVVAYKAAFEQLFEIKVEQAAVVVISPNRVQLFDINVAQYWDVWLQRLDAYQALDCGGVSII